MENTEEKQPEPKQYRINTFNKLCEVITKENFEALTTDLLMWLAVMVDMKEGLKKTGLKGRMGDWTFIWVDDGKHDLLDLVLENKRTGEIARLKFPTPPKENQTSE